MNMWLARESESAGGELVLYKNLPVLNENKKSFLCDYGYGDETVLNSNLFPEITYEDSPVEVEVNIKRSDKGYKVGDKVRIKSLEWYNKNKTESESVEPYPYFIKEMSKFCGMEAEIVKIESELYSFIEPNYKVYVLEFKSDPNIYYFRPEWFNEIK